MSEVNRIYDFEKTRPDGLVNITGYCRRVFDTFRQRPFCRVDSLVLSQLCYMRLENVLPRCPQNFACRIKDLYKAEIFDGILREVRAPGDNLRLLKAVCAGPRFRDIKIGYIENYFDGEEREQFFAACFGLPDGSVYIGFRGTDASVAGWKEDFNMLFTDVTPGLRRAGDYVSEKSSFFGDNIILGGHSKGGSLAMFRYRFCPEETARRIKAVYNHDGPGLSKYIKGLPGYRDISPVTRTTLPSASMIGVIFNSGSYTAVKSDRLGVMNHDPFSWLIDGDGFVETGDITKGSDRIGEAVEEMMSRLSREERALVINTVFDVVESVGEESFSRWPRAAIRNPERILDRVRGMPRDTASRVAKLTAEILKIAAGALLPLPEMPDGPGTSYVKAREYDGASNETTGI